MTPPASYQLEKTVWSEADFEQMGWHDAKVHAFAHNHETFEFLLDIDYILEWVQPGADGHYSFWVAPATLVFWNVSELSIDLEPFAGTEILDITRESMGAPRNADHIGRNEEWRWSLDSTAGLITLRSAGYSQYIRRAPLLQKLQALSLESRGGYSFERPSHVAQQIAAAGGDP